MAPSMDEKAVMTMTGRCGLEMRMARSVSMPLMPGSMTSRMTRSTSSAVEDAQRFFAAGGRDDVEALAPQHDLEHVPQDFFVVDDQDSHLTSLHTAYGLLRLEQHNRKLGALAGGAGDGDLAVACVDQCCG